MMRKNFIVKASLFTLILAFMVAGTFAIAAVMNKKQEVKVQPSKNLATVTLFFKGDPTVAADVKNPNLWTEDNNSQPCNTGSQKACSMEVNTDDVIENSEGKLQLNPDEIILSAQSTTSGYTPQKDPSSNSSHSITPFNRN